jgi:hypothetical protein
MKYRIWTNGKEYKIQRKKDDFLARWVWLDACDSWCNWYGKDRPKIFENKKEIVKFIEEMDWKFCQEIII